MSKDAVAVFKPYDFKVGQKIYIDGSQRRGDWEVIGVSDNKVRLRCPFTKKEVEWVQFCYLVEEDPDREWPGKE